MPPILLDTNVLVYAAYRGSSLHQEAAKLVDIGLRKRGLFCITPQNLIEFASVVTRSRFVEPPISAQDAYKMGQILYQSRCLSKIYPKRGTVIRTLRDGRDRKATGARWYDLFLVATMKDGKVHEIITENVKDFSNIPAITVHTISRAAARFFPKSQS